MKKTQNKAKFSKGKYKGKIHKRRSLIRKQIKQNWTWQIEATSN